MEEGGRWQGEPKKRENGMRRRGGTPRSNAKEADDRGGDISKGRRKVLAMNALK